LENALIHQQFSCPGCRQFKKKAYFRPSELKKADLIWPFHLISAKNGGDKPVSAYQA
jgi:hypothetical protein